MADCKAAESTLTRNLRALDCSYSDLCKYIGYSKDNASDDLFPEHSTHDALRLFIACHCPALLATLCCVLSSMDELTSVGCRVGRSCGLHSNCQTNYAD